MKFPPALLALAAVALPVTASLAAQSTAALGHATATAHGAGQGRVGPTPHPGVHGKLGTGVHAISPAGRPHQGKGNAQGSAARGLGPAGGGDGMRSTVAKSSVERSGIRGKEQGAIAGAGRPRNSAQISGTGMTHKGVGSSTIGAAAKPHSAINGTRIGK